MTKALASLCMASVLVSAGCAPGASRLVIGSGCLALSENSGYKPNSEARSLSLSPGGFEAFDISLIKVKETVNAQALPEFALEALPSTRDVEVKLLSQTLEPNGEAARVQVSALSFADVGEHEVVFRASSEGIEPVTGCVVVTVEEV